MMFDDVNELAENKLLLLYIFNNIKLPISNILITQIVLENNLLNYFHLQQYLSELVSSGFLFLDKKDKKLLYTLTAEGSNVLEYFESRISDAKKSIIKKYLDANIQLMKQDEQISADYSVLSDSQYIVTCKMNKNNVDVFELKITVASNDQAREICLKWQSDASEIYKSIMSKFTS